MSADYWNETSNHADPRTWAHSSIGQLVQDALIGLSPARHAPKGRQSQTVQIINVGDLQDGLISPSLDTIALDLNTSIERYCVRPGDVLVTCRGMNIRVARVPESFSAKAIASASLIVLRSKKGPLGSLLYAFLSGEYGQQELKKRIRASTTTQTLTLKDVSEIEVVVPPEAVQRAIAELVDATERCYSLAVQAAARRRELGQAVIAEVLGTAASDGSERAGPC